MCAALRELRLDSLCPHAEEARSAVSKELPARTESSFETQTMSAPQDEGSGNGDEKGAR